MIKNKVIRVLMTSLLMIATLSVSATRYYISPSGNDANTGLSSKKAFATFAAAQKVVQPGDTVYIQPGTYDVAKDSLYMAEENVGQTGQYKIVYHFIKSGEPGKPICYIGKTDSKGNRPVFDLSGVKPENWRVTAFLVAADYLIFRNFEVIGIQVNRTDHTQSENIRVTGGSHNTFENIACHDGMGIGFYLTRNSAYNLFINCDGYNNYDPISDVDEKTQMGTGGNNDGFGCHVNEDCPGNIFIGCRAWNNADDGYDLINCYSPVTFCYSIAFKNGYDADNKSRGDGNGFKSGGYGMSAVAKVEAGLAPMHEVYHCIAASNKSNGIYSNHHLGGVWFHDNTSYWNSNYNYSLVNRKGASLDDAVDVNGYGHRLERNLSMVSDGKENHVTYLRGDEGGNTITDNSFYWISKNSGGWAYKSYGNSIFESTSTSKLTLARLEDGMMTDETLAVFRQKEYIGMGASFEGYQKVLTEVKKISGAEVTGTPTGISSVEKETMDDKWYDLQGRLVDAPRKGLYIRNGKKIVIR